MFHKVTFANKKARQIGSGYASELSCRIGALPFILLCDIGIGGILE